MLEETAMFSEAGKPKFNESMTTTPKTKNQLNEELMVNVDGLI